MKNNLEFFLQENNIKPEEWDRSGLKWGSLQEIAEDHEENKIRLLNSAELFAKHIQSFPRVHSVRWRIKDTSHLLEKIVRKCCEGSEKYKGISKENYHQIVTDLVGIRALHLFKSDCFEIDEGLLSTWKAVETPIVYTREGDDEALKTLFRERGYEVKNHPAGYRSVHYVLESRPLNRIVNTEVQVRTIFEEAWSEIDHKIRYPNFSDNELVAYFLTIFNRLSGSADEMGSFVQNLVSALDQHKIQVDLANSEKQEAIVAMEKYVGELDRLKKQDAESKASIENLKTELTKFKAAYAATTKINITSDLAERLAAASQAVNQSQQLSVYINSPEYRDLLKRIQALGKGKQQ